MAGARRITVAPFLKELESHLENDNQVEGAEFEASGLMSPLPPPLKGTFVDKLPTWSQTSNPDAYLNVNSGKN